MALNNAPAERSPGRNPAAAAAPADGRRWDKGADSGHRWLITHAGLYLSRPFHA